jgi:hypothetical protein
MGRRWTPGQPWVWIEGAYPPIEYDGRHFHSPTYRKALPNADGDEDALVFLVYAKEVDDASEELKCLRIEWVNGAYECVGIVPPNGSRRATSEL